MEGDMTYTISNISGSSNKYWVKTIGPYAPYVKWPEHVV